MIKTMMAGNQRASAFARRFDKMSRYPRNLQVYVAERLCEAVSKSLFLACANFRKAGFKASKPGSWKFELRPASGR